ncbi:carboxypeptidase-like regulatory domain-containing protein [Methanobrevibacter sp.]|uniref:carboxypeptidase-like regulatory domain-containing protein n=1 Tax=Methanobrevibacter sp. TaxID=66852 RepID=UPI003865035A
MINRKIMVLAIFLISLLAVSAVSAVDDADAPAVGDVEDDTIVEAPADEVIDEQTVEAPADEVIGEQNVQAPTGEGGDSNSDPWADGCVVNFYEVSSDNIYSSVIIMHWPENTSISEQILSISYDGTLNGLNGHTLDVEDTITINGDGKPITRITTKDLGLSLSAGYNFGQYDIIVRHGEHVIENFTFKIYDPTEVGVYIEPSLYEFNILKTQVDCYDEDAVIFNFAFPDSEYAPLSIPVYIICDEVWKGIGQDEVRIINNYEATNRNVNVTLSRLAINEPGTYKFIVLAHSVIKYFVLEVTHDYTDDEFIDIDDQITRTDFPVCSVTDPTRNGLNGTVSVYADGNKVYSEKLSAGQYEYINIFLDNLTGTFYNGKYKIKVVYEKSDGNTYSNESVVEFVGISDLGNIPTKITASSVSNVYNVNKYLVATLKDSTGKPISGVDIYIGVMGVEFPSTTDKNGQIKYNLGNLPPQKHTVALTFKGNEKYFKITKKVTVTVKKATPKLTAKAKTFKKSVKTKKYTVTLKSNKNKALKKVKLSLKVKGKTYYATTNKYGKATFKITKLTKKGKYTATLKFKGSKYYTAKTVKPKITIK